MKAVSHFLTLILASQVVSNSLGSSYSTTGSRSTTTQSTSSVCKSGLTRSYEQAIVTYPHLKDAIERVAQQSIGQWFTDRQSDVASVAKQLFLKRCTTTMQSSSDSDSENSDSDESRPPVVVVYGLPQKDCGAGFSSDGSNKNTADYRTFLQLLVDQAQNQRVIYILEPDAVGLLAEDGCGNAAGYAENLAIALEMLSANANADIYIDIGYWTLSDDEKATKVAKIVEKVDTAGECKGIALNTANYRSIDEMTTLCERFSRVSGKNYHCIIDTSRNFVVPATSEWCNTKGTGMGALPSVYTAHDLIDYFVWVKPPGESDGECTGQTTASLVGPRAETFFPEHFMQLWNNGVFVKEQGLPTLDSNGYTATTVTTTTTDDVPSVAPASSSSSSVSPSTSSSSNDEPSATPTPTPTTSDASGSRGGAAHVAPVPTIVAETEHVEYTIDMADDEYTLQYASSGAGDPFEPVIEEETQSDADDAFEPVIEEEEIQDEADTAGSTKAADETEVTQATEDQSDVAQDADTPGEVAVAPYADAENGSKATVDSQAVASESEELIPEETQGVPSETQQQSYGESESEEGESSAPTTESDTPSISPSYC